MAKAAKITIAEVYIKSISITVILSNFRKTRIVSYRIESYRKVYLLKIKRKRNSESNYQTYII
jgi:hypothetical protein